ncbi:delta(24)-sterol reductase-like [Carya illinoinensis]|uniref:delta(24)-sterol reductase-like n=1 Tax=Carya illinoinensis TaxID=32201 RepID=UPI001C724DE4|nr:delta(24)-sterol reductase-like [Carya illinoinensis]
MLKELRLEEKRRLISFKMNILIFFGKSPPVIEHQVYPIWLCPHRLYKLPVKTMVYPEPGFELHRRQGDTHYSQMYTDVGVYYAPGPVSRGEVFDGAGAVRQMEN